MWRGRGLARFLVLLLIIALATVTALVVSALSFNDYKPPIRERLPDSPAASPIGQQVVLFLVDGLRYDASLQMPYLRSLAERGATAIMTSEPPSYSQPAWTTLVTGAQPELNGAPPINAEGEAVRAIAVDTVFASLRRAGLTSIICGHAWWRRMVPSELVLAASYVDGEDDAADQQVTQDAIRLLRERRPNFALIHLDQVDWVSHASGGASPAATEAALRVDGLIQRTVEGAGLGNSIVIVVSDHGHVDRGGHGGGERPVLEQPFIMAGPNVVPGEYGPVRQSDVAPTIAVILGAGVPSSCQGLPLLDALAIGEAQRTEALVNLARQRIDLGNQYLFSIDQGTLSEAAEGDAEVAQSAIRVRNYDSAAKLAGYAVQQVDSEMEQARAHRALEERGLRRMVALAAVVLPLFVVYRKRSVRGAVGFVAALIAVGLSFLIYWRTRGAYSISSIDAPVAFVLLVGKSMAIGLAAGLTLVCIHLWIVRERAWRSVARTALGYEYLVLYLLWVAVAIAFYVNGLRTTWRLPDVLWLFIQGMSMLQMALVALLGLVLPWVAVLVNSAFPRALWWAVPRARSLVAGAKRRLKR